MKIYEKCLLCGENIEIEVNNSFNKSQCMSDEIIINKKIKNNIFECEIIGHCFNCYHKSKYIKEIEFVD